MAYKQPAPIIVAEGGTGATTLPQMESFLEMEPLQ